MSYVNLQAEHLHKLLGSMEMEILDLRDRYSFELGHIRGAKPANDDYVNQLLSSGDRDKPILLYCYHGNNSIDLAQTFISQGYRQVFNLYGGWKGVHEYMQRPGQVHGLLYGVKK